MTPYNDDRGLNNSAKSATKNWYAGMQLSDESFKTLIGLMTDNYRFSLDIEVATKSLPKEISNEFLTIAFNYRSALSFQQQRDPDDVKALYACHFNYAKDFAELINAYLNQLKQSESTTNPLIPPDLSSLSLELKKLFTSKCLINFLIANEKLPHQTNIATFIAALSTANNVRESLDKELSKLPVQELLNPSPKHKEEIPSLITEEDDCYTILSFPILRALVIHIAHQRNSFIEDPTEVDFGKIISEFSNNSILHDFSIENELNITQDRHRIYLEWKNPPLPSIRDAIVDRSSTFEKKLLPYKELLEKLGGGLDVEVTHDTILVTINCPICNEASGFNYELYLPENLVYAFSAGCAKIPPETQLIKFSIPQEDYTPFELSIDERVLTNTKTLGLCQNALSLIQKLNDNHSLSEAFISYNSPRSTIVFDMAYKSQFIDGKVSPGHHKALFYLDAKILEAPGVIDAIYNITKSINCREISLIRVPKNPELFFDALESLIEGIKRKCPGDLSLSLNHSLGMNGKFLATIEDSNGSIIATAGYNYMSRKFDIESLSEALRKKGTRE